LLSLAAAAGLLFTPSLLNAQNTSSQHMDTGTQKMMNSGDTKFAMEAAQGGMAEVQMAQVVLQKTNNQAVKAFAQRMVDDHTKLNDQMKQVASTQSMTLPTNVDPKDQAEMSKLSNMSEPQLDRAYIDYQVKDHEKDIKEFQKEANNGKDAQLKQLAQQALPILQSHLQMAKDTQSQLGK